MIHATLQLSKKHFLPEALAQGYIDKNWWPELRLDISLQGIAADYYLFYAVKDGSYYLQEKFEEYAQVVARQIAIYIDASIGGELRHKKFDGLVDPSRSIARGEWRAIRQKKGIDILSKGVKRFYGGGWKSGFGGPKWGAIGDVLLNHLKDETSAPLFVDLALALQHNTGTVFNKISGYWNQDNLKAVLDANLNENWELLVGYASPWAKDIFFNWITEEDEITVEGIEYSRPRRIPFTTSSSEGISIGATVKVKQTARAAERRGKIGYIQGMGTDKVSAWVVIDNVKKLMRLNSLELISDESNKIEGKYIQEYIAEPK